MARRCLICPYCHKPARGVIESRQVFGGTQVRRRYVCGCGYRFTTKERIAQRSIVPRWIQFAREARA